MLQDNYVEGYMSEKGWRFLCYRVSITSGAHSALYTSGIQPGVREDILGGT
jgi:hypothetical protein